MRILGFKITDERTKAALLGYVSLLAKDQANTVTACLAEANAAVEKGDLSTAHQRARDAALAMMAIMGSIEQAAELTGVEYYEEDNIRLKTAARY